MRHEGGGDLFSVEPYVGRNHPDTSHDAAAKVAPKLSEILTAVLAYGRSCGVMGFTDDELFMQRIMGKTQNTLRPARIQLTLYGYFVRTETKRKNQRGNDCYVYVHRDFVDHPPALDFSIKPQARASAEEVEALRARIRYLEHLLTKEGIEYD